MSLNPHFYKLKGNNKRSRQKKYVFCIFNTFSIFKISIHFQIIIANHVFIGIGNPTHGISQTATSAASDMQSNLYCNHDIMDI